MKNLKPSLLPEGTVIGCMAWGKYEELYLKKAEGVWEDLFSGCGCCLEHVRVADDGSEQSEEEWGDPRGLTTNKTSDEYFVDYKVIASDPGFNFGLVELHGPWVDEYGTFTDGTGMHSCDGYNCEA